MLFRQDWSIPKVQPVVRPDVFSMDGVIAWLETMPADRAYDYHDCRGACMYGQYMAAHGYSWSTATEIQHDFRNYVYRIAFSHPHTFGAALDRARSAASQGDVDPRQIFYIALSVDNLDLSASVDWDGSKGFQALADTLVHAKEEAEQHNAETIIVQCTPIHLIKRGGVKVIPIKAKKAKS
jgi:hypothetical protein